MFFYRLPRKLPNEKIIKIVRKDFFILFKKILFFIILIILPWIVGNLMLSIYPNLLNGFIFYPIMLMSISAYCLFIWLFFFFSFIDYYLDAWIITNERIIDIRQDGFFARNISEQRLYRVQDVTSEVRGFFPTILKYGNIYIQTAGSKERFFFEEVPNPENIRNLITKLMEENKILHKGEV